MPADLIIDFKSIVRAGRLTDDPPEFTKSTPLFYTPQTVSLDTASLAEFHPGHFRWHCCFCLHPHPLQPFPSPPPPMRRARAGDSSGRGANLGMGLDASLLHMRARVRWPC